MKLAKQVVTVGKTRPSITGIRFIDKVKDIESIGLDQFTTYTAVNVAEFRYQDDPQSYKFILMGIELAPKGQTKGNVKWRINLTPFNALRLAALLCTGVKDVTKRSSREVLSSVEMELGQ